MSKSPSVFKFDTGAKYQSLDTDIYLYLNMETKNLNHYLSRIIFGNIQCHFKIRQCQQNRAHDM